MTHVQKSVSEVLADPGLFPEPSSVLREGPVEDVLRSGDGRLENIPQLQAGPELG